MIASSQSPPTHILFYSDHPLNKMQTRSKTLSLSLLTRSSAAKQVDLNFSTPKQPRRSTEEPAAPVKRARRQFINDFRDTCNDSDNDSTSTYHTDDDEPITPRNLCNLFEPNFRFEGKAHSNATDTHTRAKESQQRRTEFAVDIDFDEASRAWRSNKRLAGEGHFVYKCDRCDRSSVKDSIYCGVHRRVNRQVTAR